MNKKLLVTLLPIIVIAAIAISFQIKDYIKDSERDSAKENEVEQVMGFDSPANETIADDLVLFNDSEEIETSDPSFDIIDELEKLQHFPMPEEKDIFPIATNEEISGKQLIKTTKYEVSSGYSLMNSFSDNVGII